MNSGLYAPEGLAATAWAAAKANWLEGPRMKFSKVKSYRPEGRASSVMRPAGAFSPSLCWDGGMVSTTSTSKPSTALNASFSRPVYRSDTILRMKSLRTSRVTQLEFSKLTASRPLM